MIAGDHNAGTRLYNPGTDKINSLPPSAAGFF
jgi:hypothetical protein